MDWKPAAVLTSLLLRFIELDQLLLRPKIFDDRSWLLEALVTYHCPIIPLGDFNIYMKITDNIHAVELWDLLSSLDMFNFFHELTRSHDGQLDVIVMLSDFIASDVNVCEVGCLITALYIFSTTKFVRFGRHLKMFLLPSLTVKWRPLYAFPPDNAWAGNLPDQSCSQQQVCFRSCYHIHCQRICSS